MDMLDPTTRLSAALAAAARLAAERAAAEKVQAEGGAAACTRLEVDSAAAGLGETVPTLESAERESAG